MKYKYLHLFYPSPVPPAVAPGPSYPNTAWGSSGHHGSFCRGLLLGSPREKSGSPLAVAEWTQISEDPQLGANAAHSHLTVSLLWFSSQKGESVPECVCCCDKEPQTPEAPSPSHSSVQGGGGGGGHACQECCMHGSSFLLQTHSVIPIITFLANPCSRTSKWLVSEQCLLPALYIHRLHMPVHEFTPSPCIVGGGKRTNRKGSGSVKISSWANLYLTHFGLNDNN